MEQFHPTSHQLFHPSVTTSQSSSLSASCYFHTHTQKQKKKNKKEEEIAATFWSVIFEKWLPAWHRAAPTSHSPLSLWPCVLFICDRSSPFIGCSGFPVTRIPAARLRSSDGHRWSEKSVHAAQTTTLSRRSRTGLEGLSSPHRSALSCFWSCVN